MFLLREPKSRNGSNFVLSHNDNIFNAIFDPWCLFKTELFDRCVGKEYVETVCDSVKQFYINKCLVNFLLKQVFLGFLIN